MNLSAVSKAIAGGLVGAILSEGARYGWHPDGQNVTILGIVITAVVGYAIGHLTVYFAPENKKISEVVKAVETVVPPTTPIAPAPPEGTAL